MNTLIFVASFPVLYFLVYLYKLDRVEKEPLSILLLALFGGVLAAVASVWLEVLMEEVIYGTFFISELAYYLAEAFLVAGLVEEVTKYFFLNIFTWRSRHFNCRFDGLVYAVFVSLGFALAENIAYVLVGGLSTGFFRAFTSIEGHMAFSIFYGYYYGQARAMANMGHSLKAKTLKLKGLILAVLSHGLYDFCLFVGSNLLMIFWFILLMSFYYVIFKTTKKVAAQDHYI